MASIFISLRISDSSVYFLYFVNKGYVRPWQVVVLVWDISYRKPNQNFRKMKVKATQSCPALCDPMDYTVHWVLQARILEWVAFPFFKGILELGWDLPNPWIEPRSPALWADSLPAESQGKPKNTGMGSLSFIQGIFPTQGSNWGLSHYRQILY